MKKKEISWKSLKEDLIQNADTYHGFYYQKEVFGGPSLHFHKRALSTHGDEKIEMVYAMLVSWGMHRMGGGATMNDFAVFKESIKGVEREIIETKKLIKDGSSIIDNIKEIFNKIKAMKSSKNLVGNSKVLAHYFPSQISPIDGEYTLQFVLGEGRKNIPSSISEYEFFIQFHEKIIFSIIKDENFIKKCKIWMDNKKYVWDTSMPKIVDNLIIGKMYQIKKQKKNLTTAST